MREDDKKGLGYGLNNIEEHPVKMGLNDLDIRICGRQEITG